MEGRLELVIGGRAQGKSAYVKKKYPHAVCLDEKDLTEGGRLPGRGSDAGYHSMGSFSSVCQELAAGGHDDG